MDNQVCKETIQNIRQALLYWRCCANYLKHTARKSVDQMRRRIRIDTVDRYTIADLRELHYEIG